MTNITDFPKIHSPFEREERIVEHEDGTEEQAYVVTDTINRDHKWVFDRAQEIQAVEKLHGTNCSIYMEDGEPIDMYTRMGPGSINRISVWERDNEFLVDGMLRAWRRGWLDDLSDGQHHGELIGEKLHNNPHGIEGHLFVPFEYLRDNCTYKSYGKYGTSLEALSDWFETELFSLFASRWHNQDLEASSVSNGTFCEGVVFYDPETGEMSKLRRDMFPWYQGERH